MVLLPNRGAYVKELTLQDVSEMMEAREVVEVFAFRKVAPEVTDGELRRLMEFHQTYHDGWAKGDYEAAVEADMAFHQHVAAMAGNEVLAEVLRGLAVMQTWLRFRRYRDASPRLSAARDDHVDLVGALASREPDTAEAEIRRHVRGSREELTAWMSGQAEGPRGRGGD